MVNLIYEKSFAFAVEIVAVSKELTLRRQFQMANQLVRSGTSIGANVSESEQAQSRADFISKLGIALKEAYETRYWLKLLEAVGDLSPESAMRLLPMVDEIIRILVKSIKTAKMSGGQKPEQDF